MSNNNAITGNTFTGNNFSGNTSYAIRHAAFNWGFFTATAPTSTGPVDSTCNFYGTPAAPTYAEYSYPPGTVAANPDGVIGTAAPETSVNFTPQAPRLRLRGPATASDRNRVILIVTRSAPRSGAWSG